jgi:hypothetical protein
MSKGNHKSQDPVPAKTALPGAIMLVFDRNTNALQHSVIGLQANEALQLVRIFARFLENAVIKQAKESARQEVLREKGLAQTRHES